MLVVIRYLLFSSALLCLLIKSSCAAVVFEQSAQRPQQVAAAATTATARDARPAVASQAAQPATLWRVESGESLEQAFRRWANLSRWQLVWEAPDLVAQANVELSGDFEEAIGKTVDALNRSGNGLQARFYAANRVLRIVERK